MLHGIIAIVLFSSFVKEVRACIFNVFVTCARILIFHKNKLQHFWGLHKQYIADMKEDIKQSLLSI